MAPSPPGVRHCTGGNVDDPVDRWMHPPAQRHTGPARDAVTSGSRPGPRHRARQPDSRGILSRPVRTAAAVTGVVVLVITVAVTVTAFGGNPLRPYLGAEGTPGATTTAPLPVPAGSGRSTTRQSGSAESSVTGTASLPSIAAAPPAHGDTPPAPTRTATSTNPQPTQPTRSHPTPSRPRPTTTPRRPGRPSPSPTPSGSPTSSVSPSTSPSGTPSP
jgi:hypothetical protein